MAKWTKCPCARNCFLWLLDPLLFLLPDSEPVFLVVRAAFRNCLWCTDEKASLVSKHPNKQALTDGLLLKPYITLQLVSVSPTDVSQDNFPMVCSGALGFPSTCGCIPRRSLSACSTHCRYVLGTTGSQKRVSHSIDKLKLPVQPVGGWTGWAKLPGHSGCCCCPLICEQWEMFGITWNRTRHFQVSFSPFCFGIASYQSFQNLSPYFLANHKINVI